MIPPVGVPREGEIGPMLREGDGPLLAGTYASMVTAPLLGSLLSTYAIPSRETAIASFDYAPVWIVRIGLQLQVAAAAYTEMPPPRRAT